MSAGKWSWGALLRLGLIAGLAQVAAGVAMYLTGVYFAPWSMAVSLVVLLLGLIFGTRRYASRQLGGRITYGQALLAGVTISLCTGVVYALYNVISISLFYPHFLDDMVRARIAWAEAHQRPTESFEVLRPSVGIPMVAVPNLVRLAVLGSVLSAAVALGMRRRGRPAAVADVLPPAGVASSA